MAKVSAWSKPGAWALESEEHDAAAAAAAAAATLDNGNSIPDSHQSTDFPSLSAAAAAKIPKKKKKQTLSLAEFTTGAPIAPGAVGKFQPSSKTRTLTSDELISLPTGPRERSEEELQRPRGFGHFNGGGSRGSDETRRGSRSEPRDLEPSRADEVDDWGAGKKSGGGFERRERDNGFFDSQSRADESDSWISRKGAVPPPPASNGRRERRGYDLFNKEGSSGNGVDSDSWGKRREENGGSGRSRLVLQPRTLPIANMVIGTNGELKKAEEEKQPVEVKSKGANPFGEARPREEVLKGKGKDWKEIDGKLEAVRIQEAVPLVGRKGFGTGNDLKVDRTERAWRKPAAEAEANDMTPSPRADSVEEQLPEN